MSDLLRSASAAAARLRTLGLRHALVGGLAVSVRTEPRFTRDVDLVVAVGDDTAAEQVIRSFIDAGLRVDSVVEQDDTGRLAMVLLQESDGQPIDLLFASSGIESEIIEAASPVELVPGTTLPVASTGHLIALKLLSTDDVTRPQDGVDLRHLLDRADASDLNAAQGAVDLIVARGYGRGRDLSRLLSALTDEDAT